MNCKLRKGALKMNVMDLSTTPAAAGSGSLIASALVSRGSECDRERTSTRNQTLPGPRRGQLQLLLLVDALLVRC